MNDLIFDFLQPPTQTGCGSRMRGSRFTTARRTSWDSVAADRLIWEGSRPGRWAADQTAYTDTVITDYTGSTKGGSLEELVGLLNILPQNIVIEPDPNRTTDFKIILGANYFVRGPAVGRSGVMEWREVGSFTVDSEQFWLGRIPVASFPLYL
jgi:hypothetical protein